MSLPADWGYSSGDHSDIQSQMIMIMIIIIIIIIMIKIIIIQNTVLLGTACILITILLKMVVVCCLSQLPINFDQSDCTLSFKVTS